MKIIILFLVSFLIPSSSYAHNESEPIHVQVTGQGRPIILIPGFAIPGEVWDPLVDELEKSYECHVVTLAGFGGKTPIEFPWLPKINQALKNYILKNNLQNASIIGHSLGGTIGLWLAAQKDLKLSELIVVDALPASGALIIPDFNPEALRYDTEINQYLLQMDTEAFGQSAQSMSQAMSLNASTQKKIKAWIMKSDRKTYVYGYTDYLKLDLRKDLKNISIPVTILAAEAPYGETMVKETYDDQYANLKSYELIIAQDSAHFIMLDQPDWFLERIQTVLSN